MPNISSYETVQSNLFVEINSPTGVIRISDRLGNYSLNGNTFTGLGSFLGITSTNSEIRVSGSEVTVSLSGIPNSEIANVLNSKFKSSTITIYRVFFDATTGVILSGIQNTYIKFKGYVNNFSLQEEYDNETLTSSNTILLICSSYIDTMSRKISGRRTNSEMQKKFYPTDVSMDRVPALENITFDFGTVK